MSNAIPPVDERQSACSRFGSFLSAPFTNGVIAAQSAWNRASDYVAHSRPVVFAKTAYSVTASTLSTTASLIEGVYNGACFVGNAIKGLYDVGTVFVPPLVQGTANLVVSGIQATVDPNSTPVAIAKKGHQAVVVGASVVKGLCDVGSQTLAAAPSIAQGALTLAKNTIYAAPGAILEGTARASAYALAKGIDGAIAAAPHVKSAVQALGNGAVELAKAGMEKAIDISPSADTIHTEFENWQNDPQKNTLPLVKKIWEGTPFVGKIAVAALAAPTAGIFTAAAAKIGYDALQEESRAKVRQVASDAVKVVTDEYPVVKTAIDGAGAALSQAKETLSHPIVFGGKDINFVAAALRPNANNPSVPLDKMTLTAAKVLDYTNSQGVQPLPEEEVNPIANPSQDSASLPSDASSVDAQPLLSSTVSSATSPDSNASMSPAPLASSSEKPAIEPSQVEPPPLAEPGKTTPASGPQALIKAKNWKENADLKLDTLTDHLSNYAILSTMYYKICKFDEKESEGPTINELVELSLKPVDLKNPNPELLKLPIKLVHGEKPNLWNLFYHRYKLKMFSLKWILCGLFYIFGYKLNIIPNFIKTQAKSILGKVRALLKDKNSGQNRTIFIKGFLDRASGFFDAVINGAKEYAGILPTASNASDPSKPYGDLQDFIERKITEPYGYDLNRIKTDRHLQKKLAQRIDGNWFAFNSKPENHSIQDLEKAAIDYARENLCKNFAKFIMDSLSGNWLFRFIAKKWVLPQVLKSYLKEGLDSAKPHNLPFTLPLTKFFGDFFRNIQAKIATGGEPKQLPEIPGSEKLSSVVLKLRTVLDIFPSGKFDETPERLKAKFDDLAKQDMNGPVQKAIHDGIVKGGHVFLDFLTDPANYEELFTDLFTLLDDSLSLNIPKDAEGWKKLTAEYHRERGNLDRAARTVFEQVITEAVNDEIKDMEPEKVKARTESSFKSQIGIAKAALRELKKIAGIMKAKIDKASAAQENTILPELAAFAKKIQWFAGQERIQNELPGLSSAGKDNIKQPLTPLYEEVSFLMSKMDELLQSQTQFTSHAVILEQLRYLQQQSDSIPKQLKADPLQLPHMIPSMKSANQKIAALLPEQAPERASLEKYVEDLSLRYDTICKEHRILQGLFTLDPRGGNPAAAPNAGLLFQLANYERNHRNSAAIQHLFPNGFSRPKCLKKINEAIDLLSPAEQSSLRALIQRMQDFGRNPEDVNFEGVIWIPLKRQLQQIHREAAGRMDAATKELETLRGQFSEWNRIKTADYENMKKNNHEDMVKNIGEAVNKIGGIQTSFTEANKKREPQTLLTVDQLKFMTGAAGLAAGVAFGPVAGAVIGVGSNLAVQNLPGIASDGKLSAAAKIGAGAAAAGAIASALPPAFGIATGAAGMVAAGDHVVPAITGAALNNVVPQIMALYDGAYGLVLSSFVSHAGAAWGMQALVDSKK